MMDILTGLLTAGSGGLFGGLMAIGTSFLKAREAKAAHGRKLELLQFQLTAADSGHLQDLEKLRQTASSEGLIASLEADEVQNIPQWAAAIKGLFRPFLTTLLVVMAAYIFTLLLAALEGGQNIMAEHFKPEELVELVRYTVQSLVFSAATAVTWWFGDRGLTPPRSK